MLLYDYLPASSHTSINVRVHDGQGLGSLFAKIFSKVAVKAAAKTALRVGAKAGKKVLKQVVKQGAEVMKGTGKEILTGLTDAGTQYALGQIPPRKQSKENSRFEQDS